MPRHQAIDDCPYTPPQPTGARCPHCGACVLACLWKEGAFVELAQAVSPILGNIHKCLGNKDKGDE